LSTRFSPGDSVRVHAWYPPGHVRTPFYARGRQGVVLGVAAVHPNPQELAYGRSGEPREAVYRVRFTHDELWPEDKSPSHDGVVADLQETWLEPAT
jgi:hypothetical protein